MLAKFEAYSGPDVLTLYAVMLGISVVGTLIVLAVIWWSRRRADQKRQ